MLHRVVAIGTIAALVCYSATHFALRQHRFDDTYGVVAVHGVGGVVGMLLVGIFAHYTINPAGLTASNKAALESLSDGIVEGGDDVARCLGQSPTRPREYQTR